MTRQNQLDRASIARYGEDIAAHHLQAQGIVVLERNRRFRGGEIDIIARDGSTYVFVEVKARCGPYFTPGQSVDGRKQQRIRSLALQWLASHDAFDQPCRFDVVAVFMQREPPHMARVEYLRGAF